MFVFIILIFNWQIFIDIYKVQPDILKHSVNIIELLDETK